MAGWWQRSIDAVRRPSADRWLVPIFFTALALARAGRFEERDPYWEARAGMENLAGWPLARPDSWSWSGVAGPWYQNSPLWNDLLGLAFQAGGYWGFYLLTATAIAAYFAIVYALALRLGARRLPALVGMMIAVAPAWSMISPRATIVVQLLILGSVLLAMVAAERWLPVWPTWASTLAVVAASAALSVVGNWLHLSFLLFSPMLAGAWGIVWWFSGLGIRRWLAVSVAGVVGWGSGVILSPYGWQLGWERTRVVQQVCDGLILEWTTPFQLGISPVFWLMVLAASVVAAAVTVTFWLTARGPWDANRGGALVLLMIGVPTTVAGWFAIRFLGIALLTLAPLAAVAVTAGVDALRRWLRGRPATRWREYTTGAFWRVVLAATMVLLSPGLVYLMALHAVPDENRAIERLPIGCQLLSTGSISDAALLLRPDLKVWIDGRADFYGRQHLIDTYAVFGLRAPSLVPDGTQCILLDPDEDDSRALAAAIAASPQWRLASDDGRYRIWLPA